MIIAYINDIHSKISIYNINMTIYALSSGPGLSGIAVIRISGNETKKVLFNMIKGSIPLPRVASLKQILDITSLIIEYTLLSIALISSVKGLFYKDSTSKKLKFLYVVASVTWLTEKSFELYMGYLIN